MCVSVCACECEKRKRKREFILSRVAESRVKALAVRVSCVRGGGDVDARFGFNLNCRKKNTFEPKGVG